MKYEKQYVMENIECLVFDSDFMSNLNLYLTEAVDNLDYTYTSMLLQKGANPNINSNAQYSSRNHGFLHELIHRFHVEKTSHGERIEELIALLLKYGANPNAPGDSNAAPIQRCTDSSVNIKNLLLQFGAYPQGNEIY